MTNKLPTSIISDLVVGVKFLYERYTFEHTSLGTNLTSFTKPTKLINVLQKKAHYLSI